MTDATEIVARAAEKAIDRHCESSGDGTGDVCASIGAEVVAALRDAGALIEWRDDWENAPKDGTRLLLKWDGQVRWGYYLDNAKSPFPWEGWKVPSLEHKPEGNPTHFALIHRPKETS